MHAIIYFIDFFDTHVFERLQSPAVARNNFFITHRSFCSARIRKQFYRRRFILSVAEDIYFISQNELKQITITQRNGHF